MRTAPLSTAPRAVAAWLFAVAAMVAAMVVIGGATRLTGSGLSMVEWRPATGWLPPLDAAEWERVFALYRESPEFRRVNAWMALEDFRRIFWWEYAHRLWGRLIGLAFALPFLWFLVRGALSRGLAARLFALLLLGGAQGAVGWWMVRSGLAGDPSVSQHRLAVHLALAFLVLGGLLWTALDLLAERAGARPAAGGAPRGHAWAALAAVSLTVVSGAVVAGLDAGLVYNTFPLMGGALVPPDYGLLSPAWRDAMENPAAAQLHHRALALAAVAAVLALAWRAERAKGPPEGRLPVRLLAALAVAQAGLGIATLLAAVPVALAAAHQAGAVLLFSAAVWTVHAARGARGR